MMASVPGSLLHPSLMPTLAGLIPLSQGSGSLSVLHPGLSHHGNRVLFQPPPVVGHPQEVNGGLLPSNTSLPNGCNNGGSNSGLLLDSSGGNHLLSMSISPPARSLTASASPPAHMGCESGTSLTSEESAELLKELLKEKEALEALAPENKAHILKLIDQEIQRLQSGIKGGGSGLKDSIKYVDVYRERPIRLTVRVLVPVREHPKFNFVGKLLGPKGNSMKRLQEETMTKMAVLGRGSMRDKQKEEELRASSDPKYQHLAEELHVEITAFAPPAEAHARIAYALTEVRKYLIPDSNDEIRQEQMREMEILAANGGGDSLLIAAAAADPKRNPSALHPAAGGLTLAAAAAALRPQSTTLLRSSPGGPLLATAAAPGIRNPTSTFPPLVHKIVTSAVSSVSTSNISTSSSSASNPSANVVSSNAKSSGHGIIIPDGTEFLHLTESPATIREDGLLSGSTEDVLSLNGLKAPGAFHDNRMKLRQNIAPY